MANNRIEGTKETSTPLQKATIGMLGAIQKITNQKESFEQITNDLSFVTVLLVNVCFYSSPDNEGWTLIDAGR